MLSGINTHSGETQINNGMLRLTHPNALSGTGVTRFYSRLGSEGVVELAHDGVGETPFNVTVAVGYCGTILSGLATGDTGINHTLGALNLSLSTVNVARAANVLNGSPSITAQTVNLSGGGAHTTTLNPTTADLIVGDVTQLTSPFRKTLNLGGTAVGNRITGVIGNGIHTISIAKTDIGTWTLTGANTYTGTTAVANGTLALAGAIGAIAASDSLTLSGGTLLLDNTTDVNADRLGDTKPVALSGGTLEFRHAGGAADYSETAGALNVVSGNGRIATSQADIGQTSALTFSSLSRTGGQIDFSGAGLGQDERNRILFTTEPVLENGIIGLWATVNGQALATYGANGVTAYAGYTGISAKGPSVIPDDATAHVRIDSEGSEGGITLAEEDTRVMTLTQNSAFDATVTTAGKTFRTSALFISEDAAALTIGDAADDGVVSALSAGGDLLLANLSDQPLTIRAAIADNGTASSLTKNRLGPVVLKGPVLHTGVTVIENGMLTFGGHEIPQTVSSVISGAGALEKTGTNQLHLFGANTFTGTTYINQGIVRPNSNSSFGTSAGGVYIADGATLDVGCTPDVGGTRGRDTINLGTERFYVCGAGVDGKGAIVNNSTGYQYQVFGRITLTGDATFGGTNGWRIRNNTPSLTLDGYTLRKVGPSVVDLYDTTVNPGAGHIDIVEGSLRVMHNARMNGGETNTITIRSGATLEQQYNYPQNVQMWKLLCEDGAILRVGQGMATSNQWGGPIILNGVLNLNAASSYRQTLSGQISGTGSLVKNNSSWVNLTGTNNIYDGITRITNGRLVISSMRNVGEPSSLGQPSTDENGAVVIGSGTTSGIALEYAGEGDTTDRVVRMGGTTGGMNLYQSGTGLWKLTRDLEMENAGNKGVAFRGDGPAAGEFAGRIANVGGSTVNVAKYDSGTWILSGGNTYSGSTTSYGTGTLYITGSNTCSGSITAYGGLIAYTGSNTCSGTVNVFGGTVHIAGTNAFTADQNVNGRGMLVYSGANAQGSGNIYVGNSATSNGVMRLLPGADVTGTGRVRIGGGTGSAGALYVTGGRLARTPASDSDDTLSLGRGQGGYGHLNISGGEVSHIRLQVGGVSTSTAQGMGVVRMTGGLFSFHKWLLLGRNVGSAGILTLDGGELRHIVDSDKRNLALCYEGGRAEVNLTGGLIYSPGSQLSVRQNHSSYPATGVVNICAGTLAVDSITNRGANAYVNFAGGTLKACANEPRFLPSQLTGVYLYGPFGGFAGGAVIDTDGYNVTAVAPLQAPSGNGVYAVTLSDKGSGYLGEPIVTLSGDGISATAVANMEDDESGNGTYRVASVTITCPGTGYTEAPEVSFSGGGNGAVAPTVGSVTLAANASGGLTKTGAGTLTLAAANTYTGVTTVAGGTLALGNAKALPTQTPVVLAGGTLDLNGYTVTNGLTAAGGSVVNGTIETVLSPGGAGTVGTNTVALSGAALTGTYLADVRADGTCDRVIVEGDVNLGGLTLTLVDPEQLDISREYTLLSCTGTLSGRLACSNLPAGRWWVVTRPNKTAVLLLMRGTLMRIH